MVDAESNNDGWVCGRLLNEVQAERVCGGPCPGPIYGFYDNTRGQS